MLSGRKRLFTREYSWRRTRLRTLTIDRSQPEPSPLASPPAAPSNMVSLTGRFIGVECESYRRVKIPRLLKRDALRKFAAFATSGAQRADILLPRAGARLFSLDISLNIRHSFRRYSESSESKNSLPRKLCLGNPPPPAGANVGVA